MAAAEDHAAARTAGRNSKLTYALVTPARNEEAFIDQTLQCVIAQTVPPVRWVIVSDGSTDRTNAIVRRYLDGSPWIELVELPARRERHFAAKVHAFNAGYARLSGFGYDIVGNLDADLTFDADYFEFLLGRFNEEPRLGVAGTPFREGKMMYDFRYASLDHVSGACQLFRRECFEAIGGYVPIKEGGIDLVAVLTARMKGWQTRTFTEKVLEHHRHTQGAGQGGMKATFRSGYHDYLMGNPLLWQLPRSVYQMTKKPYFTRGAVLLAGYVWALLRRAKRPVSRELIDFRHQEQMQRLRRFLLRRDRCV